MDDLPRLTLLPSYRNDLGVLGVAEFAEYIDFIPRRFYFITDVPEGTSRGIHAHKTLRQCLLCLKGAVTVELEARGRGFSFRLDRPQQCLTIPPGYWRALRDFTHDAVVGVLASHPYDETDYIYEHDEFCRWEMDAGSRGVPYIDLARATTAIEREIGAALVRTLRSGRYVGGGDVTRFEQDFATYCGAAHAVGVGNGLDALTLALAARGIGRGHSVVLPANTFIATALAVSRLGAQPILADVDEETANIDPPGAAAAIRADTRAIIAVHLYGHPADMEPLRKTAERHGLMLLEDAAQAHGARYRGLPCGSLGDAAAFSFYPTKNLGAIGDAGAVVANDRALIDAVRTLANYGADDRDHHVVQGINSRLDPLQAALLSTKLHHLDRWNERRRMAAERYRTGLSGIEGLVLPSPRPWATPSWHVYAARVRGGRRDALRDYLSAVGIATNVHYPTPIHRQPAYRDLHLPEGAFPVAERLAAEVLSLPLDPFHTDEEIDRVIDRVRRFFA